MAMKTSGSGSLPAELNSLEFSLMTYSTYVGQSPVGRLTFEQWSAPQTYMMLDIAALQYMYGADYTINSTDTVYTWSPATGETYVNGNLAIDPGGNRIFATIWDGGGIDTYDLSNYTTGVTVDLGPGTIRSSRALSSRIWAAARTAGSRAATYSTRSTGTETRVR